MDTMVLILKVSISERVDSTVHVGESISSSHMTEKIVQVY